jgi:hypothetical protein
MNKIILVEAGRRTQFIKKLQEMFEVEHLTKLADTPASKVANYNTVVENDDAIAEYLSRVNTPFLVFQDELAYKLANLRYYIGPSQSVARLCYDKLLTQKLFDQNQVIKDYYPFVEVGRDAYMKPRFGYGSKEPGRISYMIAPEELPKEDGLTVAQKYIGGPEYSVDCLFNQGTAHELVVRRRDIVLGGEVLESTVVDNYNIERATRVIGSEIHYNGPACFQFKLDGPYNTPKLIEINARFGGGCTLSLHASPTFLNNILSHYLNTMQEYDVFAYVQYNKKIAGVKMRRTFEDYYFEV